MRGLTSARVHDISARTILNLLKVIKQFKISLNTTLSYKSLQIPLSNLVIPLSDPVTIFYLAELLRDVLKVVKAIPSAIDTPKATKPQAINNF